MGSRRVRLLLVSPETLTGLFRQDGTVALRIEGMPTDAQIVGVSDQVAFDRNLFAFKVESAEFSEVLPGHATPELLLTVTEIKPGHGREFL